MKRIPLTQGQFALVDDEDYTTFSVFKWCAAWSPKTKSFYAKRSIRCLDIPGRRQRHVSLHREIMGQPKGQSGKGPLVDHINHDTLDCRRSNLRVCTHPQNVRNMKRPNTRNTSGHRGVSWYKPYEKWKASICVMGQRVFLGHFKNKKKAITAYTEASRKYFGDFGGLR